MDSAAAVGAAEAFGTWVIAILAIWGNQIQGQLFRPKLALGLRNLRGELAKQKSPDTDDFADARYFHVQVTNHGRSTAHNSRVMLVKIEALGPDGSRQSSSRPDIPLKWRHQEIYDRERNIPQNVTLTADLLFVREHDLSWRITPQITPFNFDGNGFGEFHIWVHLQAVSDECLSPPLVVRLDWDGQWHVGEEEMSRHLKVAPEQN